MDRFFNVELVKNPLNWLMIAGFVVFGGLALHLIFSDPHTQDNPH
jgi:hypothetical protein